MCALRKIKAAVMWLVPLSLVITGLGSSWANGRGGAAPAEDKPASEKPADMSGRLTDAEFDRLFQKLHIKGQPWARLPWKISVTGARQLAADTDKPIFMQVNQGNCLGRV